MDEKEPEYWVFTFGHNHVHPVTGEPLGKKYLKVAGTMSEARGVVERTFGRNWSMQYRDEVSAGVQRFKLTETTL